MCRNLRSSPLLPRNGRDFLLAVRPITQVKLKQKPRRFQLSAKEARHWLGFATAVEKNFQPPCRKFRPKKIATRKPQLCFLHLAGISRGINTKVLCVESQSLRLEGAVMTNNEVEQNDSRLFAFDPIGRIDEWSSAMLADPSHNRRLSKGHATSTADGFACDREKFARLERA